MQALPSASPGTVAETVLLIVSANVPRLGQRLIYRLRSWEGAGALMIRSVGKFVPGGAAGRQTRNTYGCIRQTVEDMARTSTHTAS